MEKRRVACERCPHLRRSCFRRLEKDEIAFLKTFKRGELAIASGTAILAEGTNSAALYTVLEGWAFRYKTLEDGRRQVLNFAMPGDLIGLQASIFELIGHGVQALTPMLLCVFSRDNFWTLYEKFPSLAFDVTWLAAREERFLDEHLLTVGRRTARERLAYVLWHLFRRARELGLATGDTIDFPLSQELLADTLGLSLVHTNRTLKRLRADGLVRWSGRELRVPDLGRLRDAAGAREPRPRGRPFL